jgi:hypothetical protein
MSKANGNITRVWFTSILNSSGEWIWTAATAVAYDPDTGDTVAVAAGRLLRAKNYNLYTKMVDGALVRECIPIHELPDPVQGCDQIELWTTFKA